MDSRCDSYSAGVMVRLDVDGEDLVEDQTNDLEQIKAIKNDQNWIRTIHSERDIKRTKQPSEHQIQSEYFECVRLTYHGCKLIYAVPNGGKRHIVTAMKLRAEGVTPGVPDVNIDIPRAYGHIIFHGMRIETKSAKGTTSEEQDLAILQLISCQYRVVVCNSTEMMIAATKDYLKGWKWNAPEAI